MADAAVGASLFLVLGDYQGSTVGIVRVTYSIDAANLDITIKNLGSAWCIGYRPTILGLGIFV